MISEQDTCPSIQMSTGVTHNRKFTLMNTKNAKRMKNTKNIWIVDVFHECPIHIAISVSLTFMNARQLSQTGVNYVTQYNTEISKFPNFIAAALFGFRKKRLKHNSDIRELSVGIDDRSQRTVVISSRPVTSSILELNIDGRKYGFPAVNETPTPTGFIHMLAMIRNFGHKMHNLICYKKEIHGLLFPIAE